LIIALNRLPDRFNRLRRWGEASGTPQAHAAPEPPLGAEIVTVIATVLEIEHRLHHAERGKRLTIARRASQQEGLG